MPDITLNFTDDDRRLLVKIQEAYTVGSPRRVLLDRIIDALPEPLEDGIYERRSLVGGSRLLAHVHDGLWSNYLDRDGNFPRDFAVRLEDDDASNWTLLLARTYTDA